MNKNLLFIDFESFWDTKNGYGLKTLSMIEYIRSPLFKAHGVGYTWETGKPRWMPGENLAKFFNNIYWKDTIVVAHNIKFDGLILREIYGKTPAQWIDTKGMSRAVLGKSIKSHHLAELATYYGLPSKGIMKTDGLKELTSEQERELSEYCLHDVWLCREIYKKLAKDFPENQYPVMSKTIDMFVNSRLVLNVPLLEKTAKEEALRRENIFKEIGIDKKEFASNKKFPELLLRSGYEVPTKISQRTGKVIPAIALGDTEFLEMVEGGNEELKMLCEARIAAKSTLLETRSIKLASIGRTGSWPFDVEFSGAEQTHRFSGGSGAGGNPQNFTRNSNLRKAIEAPEGYELIVGDFSNIELRLVAYLSKDPGLIQAIENGIDIYCDFASVFYGRRITKEDKRERMFGKTSILGLGYGCGFVKFKKMVRVQTGETISEKDAKKAVDLYRMRYAKVPALWERLDKDIVHLALSTSFEWAAFPIKFIKEAIELPSGLKMRYPNLRQEQGERGHTEWVYDVYRKGQLMKAKLYGGKLLENICQGLAGELCKESMMQMDNVAGLVHDEIHVLCRKGLGLMTAQKLKRVMSISPKWLPQMKLDAEVGVGRSWGEAK